MKIYFVGMHNKPMMKPLDSKTKSGKIVDLIIKQLPFRCVKTNLFEGEYIPGPDETHEAAIEWHGRHEPEKDDIIVLLGAWVHNSFINMGYQLVRLAHPASAMGNVKKEEYVTRAIKLITSKLNRQATGNGHK